jgi:hypothetical protein
MNLSKVLQFLLLAMITVGVFASMAKNGYGFTFMGIGCVGLAAVYLIGSVMNFAGGMLPEKKNRLTATVELTLLSLLLLLFGLRAFYVSLPYSDAYFIALCAGMLLCYGLIGYQVVKNFRNGNPPLGIRMALFYGAILFFIASLMLRINTNLSAMVGALGFLISLPFLYDVFRQRKFTAEGKDQSLIQWVAASPNKAGILFLFFISAALYSGLTYFDIIPAIENSDRPRSYYELVNLAERGGDAPIDGKYQHERYKQAMDTFFSRHEK